MEKLNELVAALYPQYGTPGSRDIDVTERRKVVVESAAAIAEAFRELEQRAESAEAKLAELEKQEPAINLPELIKGMTVSVDVSTCDADAGNRLFGIVNECSELKTVRHGMILLVQDPEPNFARPAPAADLVPGEWTNEQCLEFLSIAFRHAEISGDIEMDDIRLAVKMVNAAAPEVE